MKFFMFFIVFLFLITTINCDLKFIQNNLAKLSLKFPKARNVTNIKEKQPIETPKAKTIIDEPCECLDLQICHNFYGIDFDYRSVSKSKCKATEICCNKKMFNKTVYTESPYKNDDKKEDDPVGELYNKCGMYNSTLPPIIGRETQIGEFPWMVAVLVNGSYDYSYVSGGSLIHPKVVLGAAHTFYDAVSRSYVKKIAVRVGSNNLKILQGFEIEVEKLIVHEDFEYATGENDIALLILRRELSLGPTIQTICLPSRDMDFEEHICLTTGYGMRHESNQYNSDDLKKINLPIWTSDNCEKSLRIHYEYPELFELHDSWLCAGGVRANDTCTGDGGSPLICNDNGRYYQAGIVSLGSICYEDTPGVYSNVPNLVQWIKQKFTLLKLDTKWFTA